jgi:ketosteroid isomerase-like protein
MRSISCSLTVVSVAAFMACSQAHESDSSAAQVPCTLSATDVEAIRGMKATDEAQVLAADWEGRMKSFSPDFVNMPPNHAEVVGREAVLEYARAFPKILEYESTFQEIDGCGDFAYLKGLYSIAVQPAESTEVIRDTGRWIWILRKSPEGAWVVTRNISNSDQPLAAGS